MSHHSSALPIVPQPKTITRAEGQFEITSDTKIVASHNALPDARIISNLLKEMLGLDISIETNQSHNHTMANRIALSASATGDPENYTLLVTPDQIEITGADAAGLFYGVQTLHQLLVANSHAQQDDRLSIPALTITDAPRYRWRGLHLDVARHMYPEGFIKKFLDIMALHKFNVFHWHLTDDQGWRIEIKQYPRLIEVGAYRAATPIPANRTQPDNTPYGGYYTQEQIRDIVAYARDRHITIVPEIDMPGHMVAALASYPELGCIGHGYQVRTTWGIADDVLCAGNEETYVFVQNVLNEVLDLFPSEFIHIGGDECPKVRWDNCPKCQAMIQHEDLNDTDELQSYFMKQVGAFLKSKGRRMIGWDEILEGGLPPDATVMSWRGIEGGIEAASAGHDVVMTPTSHCYFDYYQSEDRANEPPAIGNYLPLEKVHSFDPIAEIPADKHHHILGGQGNIWTEYMPTESQVEYMVYPRACAMAEVLWSGPQSYDNFVERLRHHLRLLDSLNVGYRRPF